MYLILRVIITFRDFNSGGTDSTSKIGIELLEY